VFSVVGRQENANSDNDYYMAKFPNAATQIYSCSSNPLDHNNQTNSSGVRLIYSVPKAIVAQKYDSVSNTLHNAKGGSAHRRSEEARPKTSVNSQSSAHTTNMLTTLTFIAHMEYIPENDTIIIFQCESRDLPQDNVSVGMKLVQIQLKSGKVVRQSASFLDVSFDVTEMSIRCQATRNGNMLAFTIHPLSNVLYLVNLETQSGGVALQGDITLSEHNLLTKDISSIIGLAFEESASRLSLPQTLYILANMGQIARFDLTKRDEKSVEIVAQLVEESGHSHDSGQLIANTVDVSDFDDNSMCFMENKNAPYVADANRGEYLITASEDQMFLFKVDALSSVSKDRKMHREPFPSLLQHHRKVMIRWFSKYVALVTRDDTSMQTFWLIDVVNELVACEIRLKSNETVHSIHQMDSNKCAVVIQKETSVGASQQQKTADTETTKATGFYLRILEEKPIKMQANLLREKSKYVIAKRLLIDTATDKELYKDDIVAVLQQGGEIEATKPHGAEASVNFFLGVDMPGLQDTGIEVDPSDAIRYYMQSENLEALMLYLRKLHIYKPHRAESDHTELLLNLYFHFMLKKDIDEESDSKGRKRRKLAEERLHSFLDTEFPPNQAPSIQIAALKSLRNVGLRREAMKQAYKKSRKRHEAIVVMEIEDWPESQDKSHYLRAIYALEQMVKNNLEKARELLEIYGERLLDEVPREATNVMIRVWFESLFPESSQSDRSLFLNASENDTSDNESNTRSLSFPIFSKFNDTVPREKIDSGEKDSEMDDDNDDHEREICPHHFVKNFKDPFWRMVYLESLIFYRHCKTSEAFDPIIYNTLIESYLEMARQSADGLAHMLHNPEKKNETHFPYHQPSEKINSMEARMPKKFSDSDSDDPLIQEQKEINTKLKKMDAQNLLAYEIFPPVQKLTFASLKEKIDMVLNMVKTVKDDKGGSSVVPVYDVEHVLLLVHMYKYEDGILMMYEKLNLTYEIIEHYKRKADYELRYLNVVEKCEKHGKRDPNMWIQVLSYLTNEIDTTKDTEIRQSALKFLQRVLHDLRNAQLVPPLLVIQIISRSKNIRLNTIREYLKYHLEDQHRIIDQSSNRIAGLENDVHVLSNEVTSLCTQAQVFQRKKCASCEKPLQIPSALFMCGHCYHQRCLGRYIQCPVCHPRLLRNVKDFQKNISKAQDVHRAHRSMKKPTSHHFDLLHETNFV